MKRKLKINKGKHRPPPLSAYEPAHQHAGSQNHHYTVECYADPRKLKLLEPYTVRHFDFCEDAEEFIEQHVYHSADAVCCCFNNNKSNACLWLTAELDDSEPGTVRDWPSRAHAMRYVSRYLGGAL